MTPHEKVQLTLMVLGVSAIAIGLLVERHVRGTKLRLRVFSNLDNAAQNGYFVPGEYLDSMPPADVAVDLTLYADDLEQYEPERLEPYVREWMISRGLL